MADVRAVACDLRALLGADVAAKVTHDGEDPFVVRGRLHAVGWTAGGHLLLDVGSHEVVVRRLS